jgi:hypothetical protein
MKIEINNNKLLEMISEQKDIPIKDLKKEYKVDENIKKRYKAINEYYNNFREKIGKYYTGLIYEKWKEGYNND